MDVGPARDSHPAVVEERHRVGGPDVDLRQRRSIIRRARGTVLTVTVTSYRRAHDPDGKASGSAP